MITQLRVIYRNVLLLLFDGAHQKINIVIRVAIVTIFFINISVYHHFNLRPFFTLRQNAAITLAERQFLLNLHCYYVVVSLLLLNFLHVNDDVM